MKILNYKKNNIKSFVKKIIDSRYIATSSNIDISVKRIIQEVKLRGDSSLINFTKKYDKKNISKSEILIPRKIRIGYKNKIDKKIINSFKKAIKNVTFFHKKQFPKNYSINKNKLITGSYWTSIDSVGLYVPGSAASYPSSLIMNVIPAKVAGVKRIVVSTPSFNGNFNPYLLALLDILKIEEVYQIGGAHSIAAMAYGTKTIKPVNKIFGPGNAYVNSAKKQLFGKVGIDLIAGPSEIVVVADKNNNPNWIAMDLIAQAEHDEKSQCILITDDMTFAYKVKQIIKNHLPNFSRSKIIEKSLNKFGVIIILENLEKSFEIINTIAPEHLHLQNKSAKKIFKNIRNAGCVFIGKYTTEVFGDYIVGTNHILPTAGSAKFSSGLGVLDFMKRTSYVQMNMKSFNDLAQNVTDIALVENLDGHKSSVTIRQKGKK